MLKILPIIPLLLSCTTYVSIAMHANQDQPEYNGSNPLFVLRSQLENERVFSFCEHVSSISDTEKGYGLNMCGAGVKF